MMMKQEIGKLLEKIDPDQLVVESMPFGALINARTRERYTSSISDPDIAYGLVASVKMAAKTVKNG